MAIALKGDFIGFSFNNVRSESLGIVRVSSGDRYADDLIPTSQDKTVQVPGGDGTYYFGSNYTQRTFSLNIAFDNLTDSDLRKIRQTFGTKELCKLIFDERPEVYYMVKSSKPQLKYLCFEEKEASGQSKRIYKGEGTLTFTAYYPFGKGDTQQKVFSAGKPGLSIENSGDLEMDWIAYYPVETTSLTLTWDTGSIKLDNVQKIKERDFYIGINSKLNLVEGYTKEYEKTGSIYNKYITEGAFEKIPTSGFTFETSVACPKFTYEYIYY